MRVLFLAAVLVLSPIAFAAETQDRAAIERVVKAALVAPAADTPGDPVWSEMSPPVVSIQSIQFVTPSVALVETTTVRFGSVNVASRARVYRLVKLHGLWLIDETRSAEK